MKEKNSENSLLSLHWNFYLFCAFDINLDLVNEEDIQRVVHVIVEFYMENNAEADAIDLLEV